MWVQVIEDGTMHKLGAGLTNSDWSAITFGGSSETGATIRAKLGITVLSGDNTGDQTIPTSLPASDVYAWAKAAYKPTYTYTEVGAQIAGSYATGTGSADGTNTGDEDLASIKSKLGITTLSGSNTGDETTATIRTKLGVTVLSGSNTGDESVSSLKTKLGITTLSGDNTGDNAVNSRYASLVTNATHTGDATGDTALTVVALNGVNLAALATGIVKITTATGVPSIAAGNDLPVMTATTRGAVPTPPNSITLFLRGDGTWATPAGGGGGDMLLGTAQVVTASKTYNDGTFFLKNIAGTFASSFVNANTAARTYTFPDANGTVALTNNLPGVMTATTGGTVPTPPNNTTTFLRGDGTWAAPVGGAGDMLLGTAQTVTAGKTFNDGTILLKNVAGTFSASFTNTITAARTYTLPDATGTIALTSNLPTTMTATVGGLVPTPPNSTTLFLRGDGTWATPASGGAAIAVKDEGTQITASMASINFAGAGVTATVVGSDVTVTIPGGGTGGAITGPGGNGYDQVNILRNGWFQADSRNQGVAQTVTTTPTYCADGWAVWGDAGVTGIKVQVVDYSGVGNGKALKVFKHLGSWAGVIHIAQICPFMETLDGNAGFMSAQAKIVAGSVMGTTMPKILVWAGVGGVAQGMASLAAGTWSGQLLNEPNMPTQTVTEATDYPFVHSASPGLGIIAGYAQQHAVIVDITFDAGYAGTNEYTQIHGIMVGHTSSSTQLLDFYPEPREEGLSRTRRFTRRLAAWVNTATTKTSMTIDMAAVPTVTGGGAGFDSTGTTADSLVCSQTTAALQSLLLSCEP
jgi:hypothetical protein